jgi:hypothetical protein
MAIDEPVDTAPLSEPMWRVLSALMEGETPPPDALAALTQEEQAEIAALGRTAHLAYLTLHQSEPSTAAEEKALDRARKELVRREQSTSSSGVAPPPAIPRASVLAWLERLRKRNG